MKDNCDESTLASFDGNMEFLDQQKDWRAWTENLQGEVY